MSLSIAHYLHRLGEEPKKTRFLASRLLWHSRLCNAFHLQIELTKRIRIYFHPAAIPANLWIDPTHYDDELTFARRFLRPGDTFVDVGANIGLHTLVAADLVGPTGSVISVEAHPVTASWLRENVNLNHLDWVECLQCAVGAAPTEAGITSLREDDQNFLTSEGDVRIAVKPLDDVVAKNEVDLMKVDVEGYETAVFEGGKSVLQATRVVLFEAVDGYPQRFGWTLEDVFDRLVGAGFSIYRLRNGQSLERVPEPIGGMHENLLAIRDLDQVTERARFEKPLAGSTATSSRDT